MTTAFTLADRRSYFNDGKKLPHHTARQRYSITRAIKALAEGNAVDGLEGEVHAELLKLRNSTLGPAQFLVPLDLVIGTESRALDTTYGVGAINPVTRADLLIDVLRAKLITKALGATVIDNLQGGTFKLPRRTTGTSVTWAAEGSAPTTAAPAFAGSPTMTVHTAGAPVQISREFLMENRAAEDQLALDLMAGIAVAIDQAAVNGSGTNDPKGILTDTDVPTVALGTNGAALTWANLCTIESTLAANLGDASGTAALGWATTPKVRSTLRQTNKIAGAYGVVWDNGTVLDHPAIASTLLPNNLTKGTGSNLSSLIYGDWTNLVIGLWTGAVGISVNPYAWATTGYYVVTTLADVDVAIRQPKGFVKVTDIVA